MTESTTSHRQILRTSSVMAAASVINVLLSVARMKVAALTLGPVGVGLIGMLQNVVVVAASVAGLGVASSASRQIPLEREQRGDRGEAETRLTLSIAAIILAIAGMLVIWALADVIADRIFADPSLGVTVTWLALAVGLTIISGAQVGLLAGLRRIGDIARANILASLFTTIVAIAAFLLLPSLAPIIFVIASPLIATAIGFVYVGRLPRRMAVRISLRVFTERLRGLLGLGLAMTIGGLITSIGVLIVRNLILERLGSSQLGLFQASWGIATTYLVLVLNAMAADYFPRLSERTSDPVVFNRLVNEQTEVALLVGGPIIVAVMAGAPLLVQILYGDKFGEAAALLRWQLLGDVLKIASWPLGFLLLARGMSRSFVLLELGGVFVLVAATAVLLPRSELLAPGQAYLAMYVVYLPAVYLTAKSHSTVRWSRQLALDCLIPFAAASFVLILGSINLMLGGTAGGIAAAALALRSLFRLRPWLRSPLGNLRPTRSPPDV